MLSAAIAAFRTPACFKGKVNMVHMHNATLAGEVDLCLAADLPLSTATTVAVGFVAGILSTAGCLPASQFAVRGSYSLSLQTNIHHFLLSTFLTMC